MLSFLQAQVWVNYSLFSWRTFLLIVLFMIALFFVLSFAQRILPRIIPSKRIHLPIKKVLSYVLIIFEPLAMIILSVLFVLINSQFHLPVLLLILLVWFLPIRNYFSGQIIKFNDALSVGKKMSIPNAAGVIAETNRLGLKLRTNNGMYYIGYAALLKDGFMIHSGDAIGGFHHLHIVPKSLDEDIDYQGQLQNLLSMAPYIDWNHQANTFSTNANASEFEAGVLVHEEAHLQDLITLIEESGFICTIQNKA